MNWRKVAQHLLLVAVWISFTGCGTPPATSGGGGSGDPTLPSVVEPPDTDAGEEYYKLALADDNVLSSGSPATNRSRFVWEQLLEDIALLAAGERALVTDDPFAPNPTNIDGEPFADVIEEEFDITEDENPFRASSERGDPFYYWDPQLSGWVFVFPAEDGLDAIPAEHRATLVNTFGEPVSEEGYDGCRSNSAPRADAGVDKEVELQIRATLSALSSSDVDGDSLSYRWEQVSGTAVVLDGAVTSSPSFLPPEDGIYEFALTASDSCGLTDVDTVRISVGGTVQAGCATARARTDQSTVSEGTVASLDGSSSYDLEGFPLEYSWRQTGGTPVDLNAPGTATPSFTAPRVVEDVELTFELTVTNGSCSDTDTVTMTVLNTDLDSDSPVANAGASQEVDEGATVTLDGSYSADPNGLELSYSWSQTVGSTVTLLDSTAAQPTFTAPQVNDETTLTFTLLVSNGIDTDTDSVDVLVQNADTALSVTALATPNSASVGDTVELSGSASGGLLPFAFTWAQVSGPNTEMLLDTARPVPAPTASVTLNGAGTVVYSLTVTDANDDTATTDVSVSVAAADQVVAPVFDPTGGSFTSSVSVTISTSTTGASIRYTTDGSTPSSTAGAVYTSTITLSATTTVKAIATKTGMTDSDQASATFTLYGPVVANAGSDASTQVGESVSLSGSATGGDSDYSFSWSPTTDLSDPNTASPTFTPSSTGTFVFTLTVTDASSDSDTDTATITVGAALVADAGADISAEVGSSVSLDGSATGGDGDFSYQWSPTTSLSSGSAANPTVTTTTPFAERVYTLTVTDGQGATASDTVTVTVMTPHPADTNSDFRITSAEADVYSDVWQTGGTLEFQGVTLTNTVGMFYQLVAAQISILYSQGRYEDVGTDEPINSVDHPERWQAVPDL